MESREDLLSRVVRRGQVDQRNEDTEEAQNMDDENNDFNCWKRSADKNVDEYAEEEHCPQKECPVPALTHECVGIVQTDQLQDQVGNKETH